MKVLASPTSHWLCMIGLLGCSCSSARDAKREASDGGDTEVDGRVLPMDAAPSDAWVDPDSAVDGGCDAGCPDAACDARCADGVPDAQSPDGSAEQSGCWTPVPVSGAPSARTGHVAVWTGEKMLVWAGMPENFDAPSPGGGRFAPDTNAWEPIADAGTIPGRMQPAGVWTGSEMLVWGGHDRELHTGREAVGGGYDPHTDAWTPLGTEGVPLGRMSFAWGWSGEELLVWGGATSQVVGPGTLGEGARYSPQARHWIPMSDQGAPTPRYGCSAVWTGKLFIVWGGNGSTNATRTGAAYDPVQDVWIPVPTSANLPDLKFHSAIWTGSEMIVWNGQGAAYNPDTGTWRIISDRHGLRGRTFHSAIWTGTRMIIFGGRALDGGTILNDGASYDPSKDSWSLLETCNAPSPRMEHTAVWTGSSMVIWGGRASPDVVLSDGAIYVPAEFRTEP